MSQRLEERASHRSASQSWKRQRKRGLPRRARNHSLDAKGKPHAETVFALWTRRHNGRSCYDSSSSSSHAFRHALYLRDAEALPNAIEQEEGSSLIGMLGDALGIDNAGSAEDLTPVSTASKTHVVPATPIDSVRMPSLCRTLLLRQQGHRCLQPRSIRHQNFSCPNQLPPIASLG